LYIVDATLEAKCKGIVTAPNKIKLQKKIPLVCKYYKKVTFHQGEVCTPLILGAFGIDWILRA